MGNLHFSCTESKRVFIILRSRFINWLIQHAASIIPSIMIKAPFRFDVEYFSIVVTYALSPTPVKHFFRDQRQKDLYFCSARKSEGLSGNQLREISLQNFYLQGSSSEPCLYIVVQNSATKEFFCSFSKNEELSVQLKAIFGDLVTLYTFIRENCNSDKIKLTKNGNIIIEYSIEEALYTLKLENHPAPFGAISIGDIWDTVKNSWDRRKDQKPNNSFQECFSNIRKSNISIYGKVEKNLSRPNSSEEMSMDDSHPRRKMKEKSYLREKALHQTAKTAPMRPWDSSGDDQGPVMYSSRRHSPFEDDRLPSSNPKSKIISKHYPDPFEVEKKRFKPKNRTERRQKYGRYQEEEEESSYEPLKRNAMTQYAPLELTRYFENVNKMRKDLEEMRKTTQLYSQLETSISQNLQAKFELFGNTIKESLNSLNSRIELLPQRINQESVNEQFSDEDTKNAYLMFYAEKMPFFRQQFQLKNSYLIEEHLKKLWFELSFAQKNSFFSKVPPLSNDSTLKLKKSSKVEQAQLREEQPFQDEVDSKSDKDLIESMQEEEKAESSGSNPEGSENKDDKADI